MKSTDQRIQESINEVYSELRSTVCSYLDHCISKAHIEQMSPIEAIAYIHLSDMIIGEKVLTGVVIKVEPQKQIGNYRVDFMVSFMNEQFIIECDGHDFHERTKEQAQRDKKRDRDLQSKGMKVFRFSGSEIWKDSEWTGDIVSEIDAIRDRGYERRFVHLK